MRSFGLLALLVAMALPFHLQARTWKNKEGKTLDAEAVSKTDKEVTLRLANGSTTSIPITTLSVEDQVYLRNWKPEPPKRPIQVHQDAKHHDGSWYLVVHDDVTWPVARQKAEKMGGHLAVIKDAETNAFIVKLAERLLLWIGATDQEVDGLWKWVDGDKLTYTNWGPQQPNGGRRENYIRLGVLGNWIDVNERGGDRLPVGFIVQWN